MLHNDWLGFHTLTRKRRRRTEQVIVQLAQYERTRGVPFE